MAKVPEVTAKGGGLEMHMLEPVIEVPANILEKAQNFMDSYSAFLVDRTDNYRLRMAVERDKKRGAPVVEAAGGTTFLGYQYWNLLSAGPLQFFGDPPWRPSKIIAAGELTLMLGVVWINPGADPGGGIPGTVALGGRNFRVRFETIDLTNVTNGPDATFAGTFPAVPGPILFFPWWFIPPDPGINPRLLETSFTADITNVGQPFAAFGTWHYDPDVEPGFLLPTAPPHWQFERPARYLVYRP